MKNHLKEIHKDLKDRYKFLIKEINKHDYQYYVLDQPLITDYEYDLLFKELQKIETLHTDWISPDSPTQRVGARPHKSFEKIKHRIPMLSLQNGYNIDDIISFDQRIKKFLKSNKELVYFCEPKFDGLAVELIYENGVLVSALTRGDGITGENILNNIKTIGDIPHKLQPSHPPHIFEIRGEVLILKEDFKKLNQTQEEEGELQFANPRNAAAGSLRQLDPNITKKRHLHFYAHSFGFISEDLSFETHSDFEKLAKKFTLPVLPILEKSLNDYSEENLNRELKNNPKQITLSSICQGCDEIISYYRLINKLRHQLPFEIDGIVIKINQISIQNTLGFIARSPRWALAAKFIPEQETTRIKQIVVQVGRTGALTPKAVLDPVVVGGVTISFATLHNEDEIKRKDIRIGDQVIVHRAGDVIPEVVSVIKEKRTGEEKIFHMPLHCPICHQSVIKVQGEVVLRCVNSLCPARLKESIKHFSSRNAMNIDGLGDRLIDLFVEKKLVSCFSDLYLLKREQLLSLERQGEKSVQNILESIEKSKKTTLNRFIYSLGIRFVGEQTAHYLANHFKNIENFLTTTIEELIQIPEIGNKIAESILATITQPKFIKEIDHLFHVGVQIEKNLNTSASLNGLNFVITGTLPLERNQIKKIIEQHGGTVHSSVSKKINFLVLGENPGSKINKAKELNIMTLNWEQLESLMNKKI